MNSASSADEIPPGRTAAPRTPVAATGLARRGAALLFTAALLLALWILTRAWDHPITDRHGFRQLQTALSAYWLRADGFRLDYPTPLFGPPWSIPMEFPLYESVVAGISGTFHLPLEQTGRAVGIAFFLATLPALYGLLGLLGAPPPRRLVALTAVLFVPLYLFYTRTFMIESTALCLSAWFLFAYLRAFRSPGWRWTALAAVLGVLAALAKSTTLAVFCVPAAGWALAELWRQRREPRGRILRLALQSLLPAVALLLVGGAWVLFSDRVKQSNPFSAALTSSHLSSFIGGHVAGRLDPGFWSAVLDRLSTVVLGRVPLALALLGGCLVNRRDRRIALALAAAGLAGPLLFAPLYLIHDYYCYAAAVFPAAAAGWVLAALIDSPRLPRAVRIILPAAFLGSQLWAFSRGDYADAYRRPPPGPPALVGVIQAVVPPDDVVLVFGWDWNALLPYYAQRRAVMVPRWRENDLAGLDAIAASLPPRRIAAVVWKGPGALPANFANWCRWHLRIASAPVAESPDGDVYVPAASWAGDARALQGRTFAGVRLHLDPPVDPLTARLREQTFRPDELAGLAVPAPESGRSLFGISIARFDGHPVILANALSELRFRPPPGAGRISAGFGLDPKSYQEPGQTDGVDVEIVEELPAGQERVLYRRSLRPAAQPGDRGVQTVELTGAGPLTGVLIFRFGPGPAGSTAFDWSFWTHIQIR